jgi:hypothetical protein
LKEKLKTAVMAILDRDDQPKLGNGHTIKATTPDKEIWMFVSHMWGNNYYVYQNDDPIMKILDGEVTVCAEGDWQKKVLEEAERLEHQHAKRK